MREVLRWILERFLELAAGSFLVLVFLGAPPAFSDEVLLTRLSKSILLTLGFFVFSGYILTASIACIYFRATSAFLHSAKMTTIFSVHIVILLSLSHTVPDDSFWHLFVLAVPMVGAINFVTFWLLNIERNPK